MIKGYFTKLKYQQMIPLSLQTSSEFDITAASSRAQQVNFYINWPAAKFK